MAKSNRGGRRPSGGGGLNPADIKSVTDMIVERGNYTDEVDDVLTVSRDFISEYGDAVPLEQFLIAELKGRAAASTLGYYDGANIAINLAYLDSAKISTAYAESVKSGYHPGNGTKSAMAAVVAHEFGHAATDAVAAKMGLTGMGRLHTAADTIVEAARKKTGHRGVVQMARQISGYAATKNAEAVAEAFCDVYCNGSKARKESRAIVEVANSYLK